MHDTSPVCPGFQDLPETERHPYDAVCLVKQFMSSTQLSQMPLLILPLQNLKKLQSPKPYTAIPTKTFNDKTLNEFRKTAAAIEKSPFDLVEGSNYLRSLCDRSEKGEHPAPMPLSLYELRLDDFQCHEELGKAGVTDGFQNFAPGTPKRMEVHNARPNFPKENANGPVCVPEAAHADHLLSAMPAEAAAPDESEALLGEVDQASAPPPKGPKTTKTSLWGKQPGREKNDFFSAPKAKPKAKAKGRPKGSKVIKTAVKSAAKPLARGAAQHLDAAGPEAAVSVPAFIAVAAATPRAEEEAGAAKAKAKAKAGAAKAKAKAKAGAAKAKAKAKAGAAKAKAKAKAGAAKAKANAAPRPGNQKIYPTRPGYKGCSKCRRGGCANCKLTDGV